MRRFLSETRKYSPLLFRRPLEFYDRLSGAFANYLESFRKAPDYQPAQFEEAVSVLENCLEQPLRGFLAEPALAQIEAQVAERLRALPSRAPFTKKQNADRTLARICYALARAVRPQMVVETGVAFGVTTAFILKALETNGTGFLHSIDLPPSIDAQTSDYVGYAVPQPLQARWKLHLGSSRRILPGLLAELREVDIFIHDSLHTFDHMRWEYKTARRHLRPDALLISDDVEGNEAFARLVSESSPACSTVIHAEVKKGDSGVAVYRADR